ncbi:hypothetical protein HDU76_010201 [Blyttiomyces sp. JEL0837]|nr:hypothetical protein HDU76_010201 [Blyttiomyces sp. JEL0837]
MDSVIGVEDDVGVDGFNGGASGGLRSSHEGWKSSVSEPSVEDDGFTTASDFGIKPSSSSSVREMEDTAEQGTGLSHPSWGAYYANQGSPSGIIQPFISTATEQGLQRVSNFLAGIQNTDAIATAGANSRKRGRDIDDDVDLEHEQMIKKYCEKLESMEWVPVKVEDD